MTTITNKQAWFFYHNSPAVVARWEHTDPEYIAKWGHSGGLLLKGCPHCGRYQTPETYVSGFWVDTVELVTDYCCRGVNLCQCGKWSYWVD